MHTRQLPLPLLQMLLQGWAICSGGVMVSAIDAAAGEGCAPGGFASKRCSW
jgi:acyl-coenzyme A thioesterase PaaI-like protein